MTKHTFQKLAVLVALSPAALWGYELRTHAEVTASAFDRSMLAQNSQLAKNLGLDTANTNTLGEKFFFGPAANTKVLSPFERNQMRKGIEDTSISGWLMRGAIREDDLTPLGCMIDSAAARVHGRSPGECNPPGTDFNRVLNHFYDPINRRGLISPLASGAKAPDWATGATDAFASPNTPGTSGNRITGLVVNERPNVDRREYDRLKAILTNAARHGLESQNLEQREYFRSHLLGKIAFFAQVNPLRGDKLRQLLKKVES